MLGPEDFAAAERVRTVRSAFDVVIAVAKLGDAATLETISYTTGYPRSSVHRWLVQLVDAQVLDRDRLAHESGQRGRPRHL